MPELPEVETIRRDLETKILHKTISFVNVIDPFVLRTPLKDFAAQLKGQKFVQIIRKGKALCLSLSSGRFLIVQLMMTGQLILNSKPDQHTRIIFGFNDQVPLLYNDQRRFGQLRVVKELSQVHYFNVLGPEPFDPAFNADYILQQCAKRKKPVKNLLLDHSFVAGLGNIYACEILFRSRIRPQRPVGRITLQEAKALHLQTIKVLSQAIKHRGSSMRNYRDALGSEGKFKSLMKVYARQGQPCYSCQKTILRILQAGRSSFYCPVCQA